MPCIVFPSNSKKMQFTSEIVFYSIVLTIDSMNFISSSVIPYLA